MNELSVTDVRLAGARVKIRDILMVLRGEQTQRLVDNIRY